MKKVFIIMTVLANTLSALAVGVIDAATDFIAAEETFRATPYMCPGGQLTIGYGCTDKAVLAKGKLTQAEARAVLRKRVEKEINWLHQEIPHLTGNQLVAVTSLVFNIGRPKFLRSKAYQCLKSRHLLRAVHEMEEFRLCQGKVSRGLVARRARERQVFLGC